MSIPVQHASIFTYKGVDAATGYQTDMRMYKYPDFRCLKPKPGLPSSKWPHYDMENYRTARTKQQLQRVEEIPFNKESHQHCNVAGETINYQ